MTNADGYPALLAEAWSLQAWCESVSKSSLSMISRQSYISALGLDIWNGAVRSHNFLDEFGETRVDKVGDDTNRFRLAGCS